MTHTYAKARDAEDILQEDMCRIVAAALNISAAELRASIWNIDNEYDAAGVLVGHNIHFRPGASPRIPSGPSGPSSLINGSWLRVEPMTAPPSESEEQP